MIEKFLKIRSYKVGTLVNVGSSVISKIFAFIKNIFIAAYFGASASTDIYFFCLMIILIAVGFLNTINTSVIIPQSMYIRDGKNTEKSMRFLNAFMYINIFISIVIASIVIFNPQGFISLVSKFSNAEINNNINTVILSVVLLVLLITSNSLTNILNSYKFFNIALVNALANAMPILSVIFLHDKIGISSVIIGLIVAAVIQIIVYICMLRKFLKWNFIAKLDSISKSLVKNILFMKIHNISTFLSGYIPALLLSGLKAGDLSYFNYSRQISGSLNEITNEKVGQTSFIKISELATDNNNQAINEIFIKVSKLLLFVTMPIMIAGIYFGNDLCRLIFERGEFSAQDTTSVAFLFRLIVIVLPISSITMFIHLTFMARKNIKLKTFFQISSDFIFVVSAFFLIKKYGVFGLAYAMVIVGIFKATIDFFISKIFLKFLDYNKALKNFAHLFMVNVLAILPLLVIPKPSLSMNWLFVYNVVLFAISWIFANYIFGSLKEFFDEATDIKLIKDFYSELTS